MFDVAAKFVLLAGMVASPAGRIVVDLEPPRGKPDGTARLLIETNPVRPVEEQLVFAGAEPGKLVSVQKSGKGQVFSKQFELVFPVSAGQLSILHIGKAKLLVPWRPQTVLFVRYDDCANYFVDTKGLASFGDYCERNERPCRPGFVDSPEPAAHDDGMCEKVQPKPTEDREVKYCVREGKFRVRAKPGTEFEIGREIGPEKTKVVVPASGVTPFYPGVYQRCSRQWITTSSDMAVVVVGSTEPVTVDVAPDGRIVGGVYEKGE